MKKIVFSKDLNIALFKMCISIGLLILCFLMGAFSFIGFPQSQIWYIYLFEIFFAMSLGVIYLIVIVFCLYLLKKIFSYLKDNIKIEDKK